MVNNEYHRNEGNLTKRACFDAIKDKLPSSFNEKEKNVYSSRLAFEEERDDQKMIFGMLARAKMEAKAGGVELDTDTFFEQLREEYPDKSSAIKFVKHNSDCQSISEQLARAKKAAGTEFDTDAFLEELGEKHPDKGDAINFVASREKHNSNVETISDELARAKEAAKATGAEFDTDTFFEQLREKHPDKADAINFVAGREKHNSNVHTTSEALARAKMKAMAERVELDTDAFFEQLREEHPDKGGAINFVAGNSKVQTISEQLARAKEAAKAAGTKFDTDAFLEQLRVQHPDKGDAINFVAGKEKHNSDCQSISEQLARAKMKAKAERVELDTDAFFEQLRVQHPEKGDAINFVAGREKSYNSVMSKRKSMLTRVDRSVRKAAEARSVDECKMGCSIYKCIECSEKRSEEYSECHFAIAADHDGNKQMTCLLCKEQNSIRSQRFRREGSISVKDIRKERDKLDQQSKEEKKRKKSKSKASKSKSKESKSKKTKL